MAFATVILEVGDTVRLEATAVDARDNAMPGGEFAIRSFGFDAWLPPGW